MGSETCLYVSVLNKAISLVGMEDRSKAAVMIYVIYLTFKEAYNNERKLAVIKFCLHLDTDNYNHVDCFGIAKVDIDSSPDPL